MCELLKRRKGGRNVLPSEGGGVDQEGIFPTLPFFLKRLSPLGLEQSWASEDRVLTCAGPSIFLALLSLAGNGRDTRGGHCGDVGRANGRRQSASATACWRSPQPVTTTSPIFPQTVNLLSAPSILLQPHLNPFFILERISWRMSTTKGADWAAELLVFQGES